MSQLFAVFAASETTQKFLRRFFWRRTFKGFEAEDLVQEVLLRILRTDERLEDTIDNPLKYIMGIAKHVLVDYRIEVEKEREWVTVDNDAVDEASKSSLEAVIDLKDPERLAEGEQEAELLLSKLHNPMHRNVLVLHKGEGYSYEEVAEILGLSIHTVEKYVTQGLLLLRNAERFEEIHKSQRVKRNALEVTRYKAAKARAKEMAKTTPKVFQEIERLKVKAKLTLIVNDSPFHSHVDIVDDSPRTNVNVEVTKAGTIK